MQALIILMKVKAWSPQLNSHFHQLLQAQIRLRIRRRCVLLWRRAPTSTLPISQAFHRISQKSNIRPPCLSHSSYLKTITTAAKNTIRTRQFCKVNGSRPISTIAQRAVLTRKFQVIWIERACICSITRGCPFSNCNKKTDHPPSLTPSILITTINFNSRNSSINSPRSRISPRAALPANRRHTSSKQALICWVNP